MMKTTLKNVGSYLASLFDPDFIATGLKTALVVGSLLFCINHGPALFRGDMTQERWISVLLTYAMPYLVSVYGQYSYRRKMGVKAR
ncbi:MAG: nitrate/nitrite transporter NrtS [Leptolyngbyaceae cyanobacterium bins.349]|nr:nitrate/nitrite transporter NrtS [Leptolyngbyaceae cyanobacterium bins.349]